MSHSADARSRISAMNAHPGRMFQIRRNARPPGAMGRYSMDNPLASAPAGLLATCLVVEDDSIIRLDLEETLRGFGFSRASSAPQRSKAAAQIVETARDRLCRARL